MTRSYGQKNLSILKSAFFKCAVIGMTLGINIAHAQESKPLEVQWGGFVDTQFAFDFNKPFNQDRAYTTQPARHNEFGVNLAFVDAKIKSESVRGRLALQAGSSVQSNYAGEPVQGSLGGASLARHLQEAYLGYKIADRLWIDAGIYFSHIGFESWISRDNWAYTRSIVSDYSPYYQTGAKLTYELSDQLSAQVHVLNGWQNINENNANKALGLQLAYNPNASLSFAYYNFLGKEVGDLSRFFNGLLFKSDLSDTLSVGGSYDVGTQTKVSGGSSVWHGGALYVRAKATSKVSLTLRGERYDDRDQVIITTSTPNGFRTWGASLNSDVSLHSQVLWRTEVRQLWSQDAVYPKGQAKSNQDGFIVSSLAVSF